MATCREEILAAMPDVCRVSADGTFSPDDVVKALAARGSRFSAATVRTHVMSRMCANAPDHHGSVTQDLERVDRGRYRLRAERLVGCLCGCREPVGRGALYRPGHDARHASQVGRAMLAAGAEDPALLAALPSGALRRKARAMLDRSALPGGVRPEDVSVRRVGSVTASPGVEAEALPGPPPGDSSEQRDAEAILLAALGERLGVPLAPARVFLPDGSYVDVDGLGADPAVLVEAWAHQGSPKSAQRNKVLADALKLVHVASQLPVPHRKVLCLSDEEAARPFVGRSWYAGALRSMGVEVLVVPLPGPWRERILAAQARQYR